MFRETSYLEDNILASAPPVGSRPHTLRALSFLAPYAAIYKKHLIIATISLLIGAASVIALGHGVRVFVNEGFDHQSYYPFLFLFGTIVTMACASYGRLYSVSWLGERITADIRTQSLNHLLTLSPRYYETHGSGEILSWLMADTTQLQILAGNSIGIAVRNLVTLLGGLSMMMATSHKLTFLSLLVVPIVVGILLAYGRYVRQLSNTAQGALASISSAIEEMLEGIRTVLAFVRERWFMATYCGLTHQHLTATARHLHARGIMTSLVITVIFLAVCFIVWVGCHDVQKGLLTKGDLTAFIFYAILVAGTGGSISEIMGDLARASGAVERLQRLFQETSDVVTLPPITHLTTLRGDIAFKNVSFAYSSRPDSMSLSDISFHLSPGEHVAIVGESGAGKSTLLQLLMRFYTPTSGTITIDGHDLQSITPESLRQHVGWMPQESTLFSGTIRDNLYIGKTNATHEEMVAACTAAQMHTFIETLPQGYDTPVGVKGVRLSGGQKQRLGLARIFLLDPPLFLLDEPTSALDSSSEADIQRALDLMMNGRTSITIAHRLSTVIRAHRLYVLEQGRIIAKGTHEELLTFCEPYQTFVKQQNLS